MDWFVTLAVLLVSLGVVDHTASATGTAQLAATCLSQSPGELSGVVFGMFDTMFVGCYTSTQILQQLDVTEANGTASAANATAAHQVLSAISVYPEILGSVSWSNLTASDRCLLACSVSETAADRGGVAFWYAWWEGRCLCHPSGGTVWPTAQFPPGACEGSSAGDGVISVSVAVSSCYSAPEACSEGCVWRQASDTSGSVSCCTVDAKHAAVGGSSTLLSSIAILAFLPSAAALMFILYRRLLTEHAAAKETVGESGAQEIVLQEQQRRDDATALNNGNVGALGSILIPSTTTPQANGAASVVPKLRDDDESETVAAVLMMSARQVPLDRRDNNDEETKGCAAEQRCSVCLGLFPLVATTVSALRCGHVFHSHCLREHLKHQTRRCVEPRCPSCGTDIRLGSLVGHDELSRPLLQ